jgi:hypothetical protein
MKRFTVIDSEINPQGKTRNESRAAHSGMTRIIGVKGSDDFSYRRDRLTNLTVSLSAASAAKMTSSNFLALTILLRSSGLFKLAIRRNPSSRKAAVVRLATWGRVS